MSDNQTQPRALAGRRIFVTGAGGFVGSHLIERLVVENAMVGGLSRHRGKLALLRDEACRFYPCDLADAEAVTQAIVSFRPDTVLHLAAQPDGKECWEQTRDVVTGNILGTINVLEACRLAGGSVFVYGDTCKVYGDAEVSYSESLPLKPLSSYAIAKSTGWEFCKLYSRLYGLCCVALRPTLIYGPRQSFNLISFVVKSILEGAPQIVLDGGSQTRDPLFVGDAVDAYLRVLHRAESLSGRAVNLGGGCERTVRDIAELIARLMGSNIPIISAPGRTRATEMQRSYCDNSEIQDLLGWKPRTDLPDGLRRTLPALTESRATSSAGGR